MVHISDCKKFKRCPKYFWLSKKEPTPPFSPFVRMDEDLTGLACQKLKINEHFRGIRGDDPSLAMAALNQQEHVLNTISCALKFHFCITEARGGRSIFFTAVICRKKMKRSAIC